MRISLTDALTLLENGQVVSLPTETVYGLAAAINKPEAIAKIFQLKGRPPSNPLIVHTGTLEAIAFYAKDLPSRFYDLAENFWPGPLTLILPIIPELIPEIARAGLPTAGFRIPNHPLTLELLKKSPPLVMPSANISGKPSSTHPEHVETDFGHSFPVLDGGACRKGVESTILYHDHGKWKIGRHGAIAAELFIPILGYQPVFEIKAHDQRQPICPGQLFRHYAPQAKLLTDPREKARAQFILGFRERHYVEEGQEHPKVICLGSETDAHEVAENLFGALRKLDLEEATTAWIDMDFPRQGLWITIAERLERAMGS